MSVNLLDRLIGYVSPQAGVNRARNRAAMDILSRGYDAAKPSRLRNRPRAKGTSADAEISVAAADIRNTMREMVRNNPYAAKAVSELVTHTLGHGITPRSKNASANELFKEWAKVCDATGDLDFHGLVALAVRGMFESGDGIVRRRRRRLEDGLPVPLQLEVLETDLIDGRKHGTLHNGGKIIQGIEFDPIGRKIAYWLFSSHPGNNFFDPKGTIRSRSVDRSDIAHCFEKQRTQVRGVPWGTPAITDTESLASYEAAESVRKRLESCSVGVISGGEDDPLGIKLEDGEAPAGVYNVHGDRVEKFEPGMFYNNVGGRQITFFQPAATTSYDAYKTASLHTIAAGWRIPHAILSGQLSKVNYSSSKVGLEGFRRLIEAVQWQIIIPMLLDPIWKWFCEAAHFAGKLPSPDIPVEWSPPHFYSADPLKDTTARIKKVRAGFQSLSSAIAEEGENPDDVLAAIKADNKKLDDLGLILDSDPRRISQAGQMHELPDNGDETKGENEDDAE